MATVMWTRAWRTRTPKTRSLSLRPTRQASMAKISRGITRLYPRVRLMIWWGNSRWRKILKLREKPWLEPKWDLGSRKVWRPKGSVIISTSTSRLLCSQESASRTRDKAWAKLSYRMVSRAHTCLKQGKRSDKTRPPSRSFWIAKKVHPKVTMEILPSSSSAIKAARQLANTTTTISCSK